jgi:ABC-type nickel/cobalt efflux system permease component RcnA
VNLKKAFDRWSIGHAILGFTLGLFMNSITIALLFLVAWEVNELYWEINEERANSIMDILIGFITVIIGWMLKPLLLPIWPLP